MPTRNDFYSVLTAAIADLTQHGFDSVARVEYWSGELRKAAERTMGATHVVDRMLREGLASIYRRLIDKGGIVKFHSGIGLFTIDRVRPQLRAELDRRIMASASLIKLNREEAMEKTLRRFAGWATSIPKGGTRAADKSDTKRDVRKSLAQLPFIERRVLIDQGHKLTASLSEVLATDGGAIAAKWRSHWREVNYDYRPDHKERDGQVYAMRGCWALTRGFMKPGPAGYYDGITSAAEEPFCRCYIQWIHNLRSLPADMLTRDGTEELARVRAEIAA